MLKFRIASYVCMAAGIAGFVYLRRQEALLVGFAAAVCCSVLAMLLGKRARRKMMDEMDKEDNSQS